MLYRPQYCCNCGEKIERVDWNLLTSRRFCDVCAVENRKYDYAPRAAIAGGILAAVFGLGALFGGRTSVAPAASGNDLPTATSKTGNNPVSEPQKPGSEIEETNVSRPPDGQKSAVLSQNPSNRASEPKSEQIIYFCGALTKKGTPCTRKVKNKGQRCWQHLGMPNADEFR